MPKNKKEAPAEPKKRGKYKEKKPLDVSFMDIIKAAGKDAKSKYTKK